MLSIVPCIASIDYFYPMRYWIVFIVLLCTAWQTSFAQSTLPETEIYLIPLTKVRDGFQFGAPTLVGYKQGYNNQPYFSADGTEILFASNAGKGLTDIYRYNIKKRKSYRITNTKEEAEYSPRQSPSEDRISCVRVEKDTVTQNFVTYDYKGKNLVYVMPGIKTFGYYTWAGGNDLYTFMLPEPFSLVHYRVVPQKMETLASNIGRCLINFRGKIFFVDKTDTTSYKIRVIAKENARMAKAKVLVENPILVETLEGEEDFCVASDGTFLMGSEGKLYSYNLRKSKGQTRSSWKELPSFEALGLGKFYRMVLSPDNTMMAVVVYKADKP
jgi:hypothetical protein